MEIYIELLPVDPYTKALYYRSGIILHNVALNWKWLQRTRCISALANVGASLPQTLANRMDTRQ